MLTFGVELSIHAAYIYNILKLFSILSLCQFLNTINNQQKFTCPNIWDFKSFMKFPPTDILIRYIPRILDGVDLPIKYSVNV